MLYSGRPDLDHHSFMVSTGPDNKRIVCVHGGGGWEGGGAGVQGGGGGERGEGEGAFLSSKMTA